MYSALAMRRSYSACFCLSCACRISGRLFSARARASCNVKVFCFGFGHEINPEGCRQIAA